MLMEGTSWKTTARIKQGMSRGTTAGSSTAPPTIGRRATGSPSPCRSSRGARVIEEDGLACVNDEDHPSYDDWLPDLAPGDLAAHELLPVVR